MKTQPFIDRRAGLTLAELMIALLIGGMTLVIVGQASTNVRRWASRLAQAETKLNATSELYSFVQNTLSSALAMPAIVEETPVTLFKGTPDAVHFVRVEPGYPSRAGIYQYHLFSEQTADGQWAFMLERALLTTPDAFGTLSDPARLRLYSGNFAPVFTYTDGTSWQDDWTIRRAPPALVQFAVDGWPPLSIAIPRRAEKTEKQDTDQKNSNTDINASTDAKKATP